MNTTSEVLVYLDFKDDNLVLFPTDVSGMVYSVTTHVTSHYVRSFIVIHSGSEAVNVSISVPETCLTSNITIDDVDYTGVPHINVTLQTHTVLGVLCSCDLSGALVVSDIPVVVFSGSTVKDDAKTGTIDQIPARFTFGKRYLYPAHDWILENITVILTGNALITEIMND